MVAAWALKARGETRVGSNPTPNTTHFVLCLGDGTADMRLLESRGETRAGSSPAPSTNTVPMFRWRNWQPRQIQSLVG